MRRGGYIVDFWGAGFDIADRIGLLPEIRDNRYMVREVRVVNRSGKRVAGFPADVFAEVTRGRYVSLPRGELVASIFSKIEDKVETIFGDSVDRIEQTRKCVQVTFESGAARKIRSRRRSRRTTPQIMVSAVARAAPGKDEGTGTQHTNKAYESWSASLAANANIHEPGREERDSELETVVRQLGSGTLGVSGLG